MSIKSDVAIDTLADCTYFANHNVQLQSHLATWSTCLHMTNFVTGLGHDAAAHYAWLRMIDTVPTAAYVQRRLTDKFAALTNIAPSAITTTSIASVIDARTDFTRCFKLLNTAALGHTTFMTNRLATSAPHSMELLEVDMLAKATIATRTLGITLLIDFVRHLDKIADTASALGHALADIATLVPSTGMDADTDVLAKLDIIRSRTDFVNFEEVGVLRDFITTSTSSADSMLVFTELTATDMSQVSDHIAAATQVAAQLPTILVLRAALLGISSNNQSDAVAVYQSLKTNGHLTRLAANISGRLSERAGVIAGGATIAAVPAQPQLVN